MPRTVQLKEVISVIRNGLNAAQHDEPLHDNMLPISRIETISDGTVSMERVKYAEVTSEQQERYLLKEGDILFSHINSPAHIGKTGIVEHGQILLHGVNLLLLRPIQNKCFPPYLSYYLKTPHVRTIFRTRCKKAVNQASLNQGDIVTLNVPLPSLDEQKRVAAVLAKADRLRQMRRYALQLSDTYLQSVFLRMFGDPVTNPMGWPTIRLGNLIAKLNYGTSVNCSSIPTLQSLPVLRIPNIIGGTISYDDLKHTDALSPSEIEKLTLQQGDVLFVRSNGNPEYIGRCAIFRGSEKMLYASYLIRGRLKRDANFSPEFLRDMISLPSYRANLVKQARTTAGNYNINTEGLRQLKVIAPPYDKQTAYLEVVQRHGRLHAQQREAARQADHLFDTLLHRAFRGEL